MLLVLWIAASLPLVTNAARDDEKQTPRKNPHLEIGCGKCHVELPGAKGSTANSALAGLPKDPVSLCKGCHPDVDESHHPVMKKAGVGIAGKLPLGAAGEVICSSCHDVHLTEPVKGLLRGIRAGRYLTRMDLCLDCHTDNYLLINPHHSLEGKKRCRVCHSSRHQEGPPEAIREGLNKVCDFCHDIQRKDHPRNIEPLKNLPRWLTFKRTGKLLCAACHDPHGTSDSIHFLRASYLEYVEAARCDNPHGLNDHYSCRACHGDISVRSEVMRKNLLYGRDEIILCYTCHGDMDACHLVLVKLPPGIRAPDNLPLTSDGRVTCSTCHDPTPAGGCNVSIRGVNPGESVSVLCLRCHEKNYITSVNPHTGMSVKTACRFCHAHMSDPDKAERFQLSFISSSRVICLRCHASNTHPMGKDIKTLVPKSRLPKPFQLDRKGKMTCTTCHMHHFDSWGVSLELPRSRLLVDMEKKKICTCCHQFSADGQGAPSGEEAQGDHSSGQAK